MKTRLFARIVPECLALSALLGFSVPAMAEAIRLYFDPATPPIAFAAGDLKAGLEKQKHTVQIRPLAALAPQDTWHEVFRGSGSAHWI
jgi:hypothetical protein